MVHINGLFAQSSLLLEAFEMNSMRLPKLTYHEPKTLKELLTIKGELQDSCAVLAGGTDLIPMLKRRNSTKAHLLNVKRIPAFTSLSLDEKGLHIGPAVTLRDIIEHPGISKEYGLLAQAAEAVGFNQLRNMATLGGNVCLDTKCTYFNQSAFWWKSRPDCYKRGGETCYVVKGGKGCHALAAADTVSALIALDAEVVVQGQTRECRILVEDFFTGDGRTPHRLGADEVVVGLRIPPAGEGWREGFMKKSVRGSVDFSIASLSVRLKMNGKAVADARIAMNGVSSRPVHAKAAETYLAGKGICEETVSTAAEILLKEIQPLSLIGSSPFLRRNVIRAMFEDVIAAISAS
jgi:4-hydroxybenzoyl-CoA reductase subunit beta